MSDQLEGSKAFVAQSARRRLSTSVSGTALLALSFLVGLTYAFVVLGPRPLNPTDVSWMADMDPSTAYLGWAFFRQESHLAFPLGWQHAAGYPLGAPAASFDCIPLLAMGAWLVRGILPENFQYLGLYFVLCSVLQFYFGYRISRRACGNDAIAGIAGGALFLVAPAFTWQAKLGDFVQASHWLILAALDQFLATAARPSTAQILWSAAVCFIAASINPYIAVMVLLISCATCVRPSMGREKCLGRVGLGLGAALCSTLLGFVLFGFIRTGDISQFIGGGYGFYSMNLLAPIDPQVHESLVLRQQPIFRGQYVGYNYLGLGLLLLGFAAIARTPSSFRVLFRRTAVPVLIVFGLSWLLALSTKATVGTRVLYDLPVPRLVMDALASFQCSGRLFWPAYYLIFTAVIATTFRAFRDRWLYVALTAALIVQWLDLGSLRTASREHWQSALTPALPAEAPWSDLGRMHKHLLVLPPWQCSADTPGGTNSHTIFGRLALQQHMTVNTIFVGRISDSQYNFFCNEQIAKVEQDGLRTDTAYVFAKSMVGRLIGLDYGGNYCRHEEQYILCSRAAGRSGLDPAVLGDIEILHRGDRISFAGSNKIADRLIGRGWSFPEAWGRWMRGHSATLVFRLPGEPTGDLRIELSVVPFIPPTHSRQSLTVLANGKLVTQQTFEQGTSSDVHIVIPKQMIGGDGLVRLELHSVDPISPAALGLSADTREFSIGVTQLRIHEAEN